MKWWKIHLGKQTQEKKLNTNRTVGFFVKIKAA
jgi:hypothetical protein